MLISRYEEKCTYERIRAFEEKHNITLSVDYKDFLIKYNGGETPKTNFSKGAVQTDVRRFYGFTKEHSDSDLLSVIESDLGEVLISKCKLPVATNSFGDYFVLNVSEKAKGAISFVYHDNIQKEITVSSDFKEFVSLCKSEKIGHIRSIEERKKCLIEAGKGDKITQVKIYNWQKEIDKYAGINQEEVIF